jgi:hypothetical protein
MTNPSEKVRSSGEDLFNLRESVKANRPGNHQGLNRHVDERFQASIKCHEGVNIPAAVKPQVIYVLRDEEPEHLADDAEYLVDDERISESDADSE